MSDDDIDLSAEIYYDEDIKNEQTINDRNEDISVIKKLEISRE